MHVVTSSSLSASSSYRLSIAQRWRNILVCSVKEWFAQRCSRKGAALAFYTLFSLTPIFVLMIAIAGAVFGKQAAQGVLFDQLKHLVGAQSAQAIQALVIGAHEAASGRLATMVATLLLWVGATTVFAELKESLDDIWHVSNSRTGIASAILTRLLSFLLVLVLGGLLLVTLVISAALALLERFLGGVWTEFAFVFSVLSSFSLFVVIASLFAVIYKMLPQVRLTWRDVWIGALGTAGLFICGKQLIGLYLTNSAMADSYGAAGSLVALLLWVYYSAQIFFFGAQFTRQYALWLGSHASDIR